MSVDGRLMPLWKYPRSQSQQEAEEFFMRWVRLGSVEPPSQHIEESNNPQQKPQGGGNPGQPVPASRVDVGYPIGSVPPAEDAEARARRTERRDERRLCVEIGAFFVGSVGLLLLLFTLYETQEATEALQKQTELSARPWISIDVGAAQPLVFNEKGAEGLVRFTLKNLGDSPTRYARLHYDVLLLVDGREGHIRQKEICDRLRTLSNDSGEGSTILPGEQTLQRSPLRIKKADVEKGTVRLPGRSLYVLPAVVGCVGYEFTFAESHHQTPFIFLVMQPDPVNPDNQFLINPNKGIIPTEQMKFVRDDSGLPAD